MSTPLLTALIQCFHAGSISNSCDDRPDKSFSIYTDWASEQVLPELSLAKAKFACAGEGGHHSHTPFFSSGAV